MLKIKVNRRRGDMDKPGNIQPACRLCQSMGHFDIGKPERRFVAPGRGLCRTVPDGIAAVHQAGAVILGCLG